MDSYELRLVSDLIQDAYTAMDRIADIDIEDQHLYDALEEIQDLAYSNSLLRFQQILVSEFEIGASYSRGGEIYNELLDDLLNL